jgi:hypothetical protein
MCSKKQDFQVSFMSYEHALDKLGKIFNSFIFRCQKRLAPKKSAGNKNKKCSLLECFTFQLREELFKICYNKRLYFLCYIKKKC